MVDKLVLQIISHCIVNAKGVTELEQHLITQSKVYDEMKTRLSNNTAPKNKDGTIRVGFKDLNNLKILYALHKKENYKYNYNDYRPIGLYDYILDKFKLDLPYLKSYMELNDEEFVNLYKACENTNKLEGEAKKEIEDKINGFAKKYKLRVKIGNHQEALHFIEWCV